MEEIIIIICFDPEAPSSFSSGRFSHTEVNSELIIRDMGGRHHFGGFEKINLITIIIMIKINCDN